MRKAAPATPKPAAPPAEPKFTPYLANEVIKERDKVTVKFR
jgi:hypothetical protein